MKTSLLSLGLLSALVLCATPVSARTIESLPSGQTPQRVSARTLRTTVRQAAAERATRRAIQSNQLLGIYDNKQFGIRMRYPAQWDRQDLNQEEDSLTLLVLFLSPVTRRDATRENINIVVEDLSAHPLTLNEYTEMGLEKEKSFFATFTLLRSERITLGGLAAQRVVFEARTGDTTMKYEQAWFLRGTNAYVWTFADAAETFDEHVGRFEHVLDTIEVY